jgi:phosphomevalonate kinase
MVDNQHRPILLCFSGKRRSGKDFVCNRLQKLMDSKGMLATIRGISYPLKEEYAQLHKLDAKKLKFDSEYKESVRKSMVDFGEKIRQQDPTYFCRSVNISELRVFYNFQHFYIQMI